MATLAAAQVEFIVVGGVAAILNEVMYRTDDVDMIAPPHPRETASG